MRRLAVGLFFSLSVLCTIAQTTSQAASTSDSQAVLLAQQSIAVLTGGTSISDVTLNTNVISIMGPDSDTGRGILYAKGTSESRVDVSLSSGNRSDVRNTSSNFPGGAWSKDGDAAVPYAIHNCWTDAAWFFPALSVLTQAGNPNFVFKYIGQDQQGGVNTQHIQVFQTSAQDSSLQVLSAMDFYLDSSTLLPLRVAFNLHPDDDMRPNVPIQVNLANYQPVNGIQVPFHVQRMLNGSVVFDLTVTSVAFNTGLLDSLFTLQ